MSYILEALKKSQQEREAIAAEHPPVFTQAVSTDKAYKTTLLLTILFISVLLLAILLFFTLKSTPHNTEQVIQIKPTKTLTTKIEMVERVISPPEVQTVVEAENLLGSESKEAAKKEDDNGRQTAAVQERRLPPLDSLRKIPALIINSHIYSSLPEKRSVTINNKTQREGDYLTSDVFIREITAQGLIIEVDGWPLNISRQQGWQPIPEGS